MRKIISMSLVLVSASAFASNTVKVRVTCYNADGSGKAAIVQAVGIKNGVLSGVELDKSNPNNPVFKETFSAPAEGCFVEAQTDDMPGIPAK